MQVLPYIHVHRKMYFETIGLVTYIRQEKESHSNGLITD